MGIPECEIEILGFLYWEVHEPVRQMKHKFQTADYINAEESIAQNFHAV